MLRKAGLLFLYFCVPFIVKAQSLSSIPKGFYITCGDDKVMILNPELGTDSSAIVWQWSVKEAKDQLPGIYKKRLETLDECKPVNNNRKLLLTASSGATCLLDIKNKKVDFYAHTPMAHSAELLPGGYIAVVNSTHPEGNSLELYNVRRPEKILQRDSLYSGHGVVWNKKRKRLYVLGGNELRTYTFNRRKEILKKVSTQILPGRQYHDLSIIDNNRLLLTNPENVLVYHIPDKNITSFSPLEKMKNVKSVNYNPKTKHLVYTRAEISWWTHHIYSKNPDSVITLPSVNLYKVRVAK